MESGNCTILSNALFKHRDTLTLSHKLHLHLFMACDSVSDYRDALEKLIRNGMWLAGKPSWATSFRTVATTRA